VTYFQMLFLPTLLVLKKESKQFGSNVLLIFSVSKFGIDLAILGPMLTKNSLKIPHTC